VGDRAAGTADAYGWDPGGPGIRFVCLCLCCCYPLSFRLGALRPFLCTVFPCGWLEYVAWVAQVLGFFEITGTPAQIARGSDDIAMLNLDDNRVRRKNTPGDQAMRRSIQDLVASVDPNVKIEPEVEDVSKTLCVGTNVLILDFDGFSCS
jgi:hypothetical protein